MEARHFVMGATHACFLSESGKAQCWGGNQFAELGRSKVAELPLEHRASPSAVESELRFRSLSSGYFHTCGLTDEGGVACWGQNSFHQIDDGDSATHAQPTPLALTWRGGSKRVVVRQVATGSEHTCALDSEGKVACRGSDQYGQLGNRAGETLEWKSRIRLIAAGRHHTCAIDGSNQILCWGSNFDGQLGTAPSSPIRVPLVVGSLSNASDLRCGARHCCAAQMDARVKLQVYCWGSNQSGQLGRPSETGWSAIAPVPETMLDEGDAWSQVEPGGRFSCGRSQRGKVYCWGDNHDFVLGVEEELEQLPRLIALPGPAVQIQSGPRSVCASVKPVAGASGEPAGGSVALYCWGANRRGLLGLDPDEPMAEPQRLPFTIATGAEPG